MIARPRIARITFGLLAVSGLLLSGSACLLLNARLGDKPSSESLPQGYVDDASRMNPTRVAEVWPVPADASVAENQIRELLARARADRLKVSIAGARHSMGGHTVYPDGIVLDMRSYSHMELDRENSLLHVGAGARWSEVIPFLDASGFSVSVMQSNNDFSIGGSLSVNCHGWQHNAPPIASTVASFRLMTADGTVLRCSRSENPELFSLALGGYGLFGIILDVDLRVVPNERYRAEQEILPAEMYVGRFEEKVNQATDIGMVYGRLCVVPGEATFLREAILVVLRRAPCSAAEIPRLDEPKRKRLHRDVYRAQIGSQAGKEFRWKMEKAHGKKTARQYVSRNQLLNTAANVYAEQNRDRTDILHEYFVPPEQLAAFLDRARVIIPRHAGDLLNVTVRQVLEDRDSFLRYASREMFSLVMLFNQPRNQEADADMQTMTRELIDAAIECGGRYYLPYRLHATRDQFERAYPEADAFFERKRRYDPQEIFQNQFYVKYGRE